MPDDAATGLRIDSQQWEALNDFIAQFPDAHLYQELRDIFVADGFESETLGLSGWCVSVANNSTFTNHASTQAEANVKYVEAIFVSEGGDGVRFSPIQVDTRCWWVFWRTRRGTLRQARNFKWITRHLEATKKVPQ